MIYMIFFLIYLKLVTYVGPTDFMLIFFAKNMRLNPLVPLRIPDLKNNFRVFPIFSFRYVPDKNLACRLACLYEKYKIVITDKSDPEFRIIRIRVVVYLKRPVLLKYATIQYTY